MQWLTLNEAAAYLKVKPRTLAQWVKEKKVPGHKLSGTQRCVWRFLEHELDATLGVSSTDSARGETAVASRAR
jgi:excisionase family DNA binding protein